jgi:hypothetical protein
MEARAGVSSEEDVPFGIRALQMGIEVEGVWISRPGTPAPSSPILSPLKVRAPSIAPSVVGGVSIGSAFMSGTRPTFNHLDEVPAEQSRKADTIKGSKPPSLTLEAFDPLFGRESFDLPLEYPPSEVESSAAAYSSTLDALEGRGRSWGKRCKYFPTVMEANGY